MANQLVGLSFSFCINDILLGKIAEEDVDYIIASTAAWNASDWTNVIKTYKARCWYHAPEKAEAIAWRFINEDKVVQPCVGQSLGDLDGYVPLSSEGVVQLGAFGANWIDPSTKKPRHL